MAEALQPWQASKCGAVQRQCTISPPLNTPIKSTRQSYLASCLFEYGSLSRIARGNGMSRQISPPSPDRENNTTLPGKIANLETNNTSSSMDSNRELTWLCTGCTRLGNVPYEGGINAPAPIPVMRYPRNTGCLLCTILHEKAATMRQEDKLESSMIRVETIVFGGCFNLVHVFGSSW